MTDNEIIKALRLCRRGNCSICTVHCTDVRDGAYNLINRQKAEIERLKSTLDDVLDRQPLLVERAEQYAKTEAIKEFAERLKEPFETYWDAEEADALHMVGMIDCLVKEMVGEGNKQRKEDEGK